MRLIWYGKPRWSSTRFRGAGETPLSSHTIAGQGIEPVRGCATGEGRSPNGGSLGVAVSPTGRRIPEESWPGRPQATTQRSGPETAGGVAAARAGSDRL